MPSGVIITLTDRGFGFIAPDTEERSLFFHSKDLQGITFEELRCGDLLEFELAAGEKGPMARLVQRYAGPAEPTNQHELPPPPPPILVRALQECSNELVDYLSKHPERLRDLHPGTFEEVVATIFRQEGFITERISSWNEPDGGVDLIAVRHLSAGLHVRVAIQCKRWAQTRRISAEPLRSLAGVLDRFHAHAGVVATTGFFSEQAKEETTRYLWRISLRDYDDILASLMRLKLTQQGLGTIT
jgi:cold shock CspA family protein